MIQLLKRKVYRLGTFLLYGGTQRLRDYEIKIFDQLPSLLNVSDQIALKEQLSNLDHLKRLHKDRMVTFYFFKEKQLTKFSDLSDESRIAAFKIKMTNNTLTVNIVIHRGLLSSFEFSKSPSYLENKFFEINYVKNPKTYKSLAENIDESEHG